MTSIAHSFGLGREAPPIHPQHNHKLKQKFNLMYTPSLIVLVVKDVWVVIIMKPTDAAAVVLR